MSKKTPPPEAPEGPPAEPPAVEPQKLERGYAISLSGPAAEELKALAAELGEPLGAVKDRVAAYFSDPDHPDHAVQLFSPVRRAIRLDKAASLEAEARRLRDEAGEAA